MEPVLVHAQPLGTSRQLVMSRNRTTTESFMGRLGRDRHAVLVTQVETVRQFSCADVSALATAQGKFQSF